MRVFSMYVSNPTIKINLEKKYVEHTTKVFFPV